MSVVTAVASKPTSELPDEPARLRAFWLDDYFAAKVLGSDPLTDIAVIQLQGASGLKPATLGASSTMSVGVGAAPGVTRSSSAGSPPCT
mgnify:CR=1 FL=1